MPGLVLPRPVLDLAQNGVSDALRRRPGGPKSLLRVLRSPSRELRGLRPAPSTRRPPRHCDRILMHAPRLPVRASRPARQADGCDAAFRPALARRRTPRADSFARPAVAETLLGEGADRHPGGRRGLDRARRPKRIRRTEVGGAPGAAGIADQARLARSSSTIVAIS